MAKKQTRRSISVSRVTYERLKAFCEANNISMSQFVETRVGESLPNTGHEAPRPVPVAPVVPRERPAITHPTHTPMPKREVAPPAPAPAPMTSVAARFAVEPPPPIIKPRQETSAPKPVEKRAEQIFTF